jgi:hypothetical protein
MNRKMNMRYFVIGLFIASLSFWNFTNLEGGENIKAIHIVSLLVCGIGLGVAIVAGFLMPAKNEQ